MNQFLASELFENNTNFRINGIDYFGTITSPIPDVYIVCEDNGTEFIVDGNSIVTVDENDNTTCKVEACVHFCYEEKKESCILIIRVLDVVPRKL